MVSFDEAEICVLIGCLLFHSLYNIIDPSNLGLYWDDRLILVDDFTPRKGDVIWNKLQWLFNIFGFKLDIQNDLKITKSLDITLNLYNNTISPFRTNNQYPHYINTGSSHPKKGF